MYGMSAKDRLKLFEKKDSGDTKKSSSAPKKIGKLGIKKDTDKKSSEKKTTVKKSTTKTEELKKEEPKKDESAAKLTEPQKEEAAKIKLTDDSKQDKSDTQVEKTKEDTKSKEKSEDKKKTEKVAEKKEEKKTEEKALPAWKQKLMQEKMDKDQSKTESKQKDDTKKASVQKPKEEKKIGEESKKPEQKKTDQESAKTPEQSKVEPKKPEPPKAEPKKPEPPKAEPKKPEPPKAEPKKPEPPKAEPKKTEPPKAEPKKSEPPKAEPKKPEPPKAEAPKTEPPKPKEEPKKPEPSKPKEAPKKPEPPKQLLKPGSSVIIDDLDLDSELEANLGVMSDVEIQSPTGETVPKDLLQKGGNQQVPLQEQKVNDKNKKVEDEKTEEVESKKEPKKTETAQVVEERVTESKAEQVKTETPTGQKAKVDEKKTPIQEKTSEPKAQTTEVKKDVVKTEKHAETKVKDEKLTNVEKQVKPQETVKKEAVAPNTQKEGKVDVVKKEPQKSTEVVGNLDVEIFPPTNLQLKSKSQEPTANKGGALSVELLPKTEVALTSQHVPKEKSEKITKVVQDKKETKDVTDAPDKSKHIEATGDKVVKEVSGAEVKEVSETNKDAIAPVDQKVQQVTDAEDKEVSQILEDVVKQEEKPQEPEVIMEKSFTESVMPSQEFKPIPEEFYNTIFYFSGMGSVVGSALAEGVYVSENNARISLDNEEVQSVIGRKTKSEADKETVIKSARTQATDISHELKSLQSLLDSLPTFLDTGIDTQPLVRPSDKPLKGQRLPPINTGQHPGRVKQPSVPVPPKPAFGIPTGNQMIQDGFGLMGHPPTQPGHAGIRAAPFVPPALKVPQETPSQKVVKAASPPKQVPPPPAVAPPPPPPPPPQAPAQQNRVPPPLKDIDTSADTSQGKDAIDSKEVKESTLKSEDAPIVKQAPSQNQTSHPPVPPVPPAPPLPPAPSGGVPVLPLLTSNIPSQNKPQTWKPPVDVAPPVHKPGSSRPSDDSVPMGRSPGEYLGLEGQQVTERIAPRENQPKHGGVRPFGVHTGEAKIASQPWQDKYGKQKVEVPSQPKPFKTGTVDSKGLKPWQLSRLRTLEAQGFLIKQPDDHDTYASIEASRSEQDLPSLTPYLVSNKSKGTDLQNLYKKSSGQKPTKLADLYQSAPKPVTPKANLVQSQVQTPVKSGSYKVKSKSFSAPSGKQYRPVSAPKPFSAAPTNYNANALSMVSSLPYVDL